VNSIASSGAETIGIKTTQAIAVMSVCVRVCEGLAGGHSCRGLKDPLLRENSVLNICMDPSLRYAAQSRTTTKQIQSL